MRTITNVGEKIRFAEHRLLFPGCLCRRRRVLVSSSPDRHLCGFIILNTHVNTLDSFPPPPPRRRSPLEMTFSSLDYFLHLTFDPSSTSLPTNHSRYQSGTDTLRPRRANKTTYKSKKSLQRSAKNLPPVVKRRAPHVAPLPPPTWPPGGAAPTSQYYNHIDKKRQPCTLLLNAVHW